MEKQTRIQHLETVLVKTLRELRTEGNSPVVLVSNWEQGTIQISIQEVQK